MKKHGSFQTNHDGKCDTCSNVKSLDMMVRKRYKKGLYECVDCKVDRENKKETTEQFNKNSLFRLMLNSSDKQQTKLSKILAWCTG